jgi:hypothetical protein
MYPNPEYVKTRLWEMEEDVIRHHLSVPRGIGPRVEMELRQLGTRAHAAPPPRRFGSLVSAIVRVFRAVKDHPIPGVRFVPGP